MKKILQSVAELFQIPIALSFYYAILLGLKRLSILRLKLIEMILISRDRLYRKVDSLAQFFERKPIVVVLNYWQHLF